MYSENRSRREMASSEASGFLPLQRSKYRAICVFLGLLQSSVTNSQDEPPCLHRISLSFRTLLDPSIRIMHRRLRRAQSRKSLFVVHRRCDRWRDVTAAPSDSFRPEVLTTRSVHSTSLPRPVRNQMTSGPVTLGLRRLTLRSW